MFKLMGILAALFIGAASASDCSGGGSVPEPCASCSDLRAIAKSRCDSTGTEMIGFECYEDENGCADESFRGGYIVDCSSCTGSAIPEACDPSL